MIRTLLFLAITYILIRYFVSHSGLFKKYQRQNRMDMNKRSKVSSNFEGKGEYIDYEEVSKKE
ncbi:MAG: hypothetical protein OXB93_03500 [Cytophagales bacterium]|nr:hypothetical protein [Cytophagales bacterium]